mgnify:CR=1 FL=1
MYSATISICSSVQETLASPAAAFLVFGFSGIYSQTAAVTSLVISTKASNLGVSRCDLLIALGARFSDRVTGNPKKFAENARIVHRYILADGCRHILGNIHQYRAGPPALRNLKGSAQSGSQILHILYNIAVLGEIRGKCPDRTD